jgi:CheY-like chemotaxis protein
MGGMKIETRIIFVEDVPAEAARVEGALSKGGLVFQLQRVDTREAFLRVLESPPPDVILSDHGLPSFDGFAALAIAREKCPQVPFIFVTNALTREMEIEKLTPGIADYIPKNRLDDLVPAICRVLYEAEVRPMRQLTRENPAPVASETLPLLVEFGPGGSYLPICSNCKKIRDKQDQWQMPEVFFMKHLGLKFTHGICPDCARKFSQ